MRPHFPSSSERQDKAPPKPEKNPAAVALGRLDGLKGGNARAQRLSQEIARLAAKSRRSRLSTKDSK